MKIVHSYPFLFLTTQAWMPKNIMYSICWSFQSTCVWIWKNHRTGKERDPFAEVMLMPPRPDLFCMFYVALTLLSTNALAAELESHIYSFPGYSLQKAMVYSFMVWLLQFFSFKIAPLLAFPFLSQSAAFPLPAIPLFPTFLFYYLSLLFHGLWFLL